MNFSPGWKATSDLRACTCTSSRLNTQIFLYRLCHFSLKAMGFKNVYCHIIRSDELFLIWLFKSRRDARSYISLQNNNHTFFKYSNSCYVELNLRKYRYITEARSNNHNIYIRKRKTERVCVCVCAFVSKLMRRKR